MKYALAGLIALGVSYGASAQAAPALPAGTQITSSDAIQKVQYYPYYYDAPWRHRRWRYGFYGPYRPWRRYPYYHHGYYRPWGPAPWYW
jgi:hypothetical protein